MLRAPPECETPRARTRATSGAEHRAKGTLRTPCAAPRGRSAGLGQRCGPGFSCGCAPRDYASHTRLATSAEAVFGAARKQLGSPLPQPPRRRRARRRRPRRAWAPSQGGAARETREDRARRMKVVIAPLTADAGRPTAPQGYFGPTASRPGAPSVPSATRSGSTSAPSVHGPLPRPTDPIELWWVAVQTEGRAGERPARG